MNKKMIGAALLIAGTAVPLATACWAQTGPAAGGSATVATAAGTAARGEGSNSINNRDPFGMTPLHHAVLSGQTENVGLMLASGADVNAQDGEGQSALHLAAQDGRADIVAQLIQAHARLDLKDEDGMTALDWASAGGYHDVMALLVAK